MDLILYTRPQCHLCEEFLGELELWCAGRGVVFRRVDVDADPRTREAYGLMIPVLELDGEALMSVRFDAAVLERALAR